MGMSTKQMKKEMERKMEIKRFKKRLLKEVKKTEDSRVMILERTKEAKKNGLEKQYKMGIMALKQAVHRRYKAEEMLMQYELFSSTSDLNNLSKDFLKANNFISKDINKSLKGMNFEKSQAKFVDALTNFQIGSEKMGMYMENAEDMYEDLTDDIEDVSDEEILNMLNETPKEDELDKKLQELEGMLGD